MSTTVPNAPFTSQRDTHISTEHHSSTNSHKQLLGREVFITPCSAPRICCMNARHRCFHSTFHSKMLRGPLCQSVDVAPGHQCFDREQTKCGVEIRRLVNVDHSALQPSDVVICGHSIPNPTEATSKSIVVLPEHSSEINHSGKQPTI